jgi:hypothetical protein
MPSICAGFVGLLRDGGGGTSTVRSCLAHRGQWVVLDHRLLRRRGELLLLHMLLLLHLHLYLLLLLRLHLLRLRLRLHLRAGELLLRGGELLLRRLGRVVRLWRLSPVRLARRVLEVKLPHVLALPRVRAVPSDGRERLVVLHAWKGSAQ